MFSNLKELIETHPDEQTCREYLAKQRWENGKAICPYCNCGKCYVVNKGKRYKCSECKLLFSVLVGTHFEDSKIPLGKWFLACYLISSHKKGISSHQLAKDIGTSQKTAWFMLHRIRAIMQPKENIKLDNIVEADEVYMGGKVSNMSKSKRKMLRETHQTYNTKTMVMGIIERGGNLKLITIGRPNNVNELQPTLENHVDKDAVIITDSLAAYNGIDKNFAGHEVVKHTEMEYVKDGGIHTNTVEGAFSHFKRSIYGIYHFCTAKHLNQYCGETMFRYNLRKMKDTDRFNYVLQTCQGRLDYKTLIQKTDTPNQFIDSNSLDAKPPRWGKKIVQLQNGKIIATFGSLLQAAATTGVKRRAISKAVKGFRKSAGGFQWQYAK